MTQKLRDSIIAHNLDIISASQFDLDDAIMRLAENFSRIHGRVRVTNEKTGIHFYMPSPVCLETDGAIELEKKHLAVNVEKYLYEDGNQDRCALCMKTWTAYNVSDLLSMPPLSERGFEYKPQVIKVPRVNVDSMEQDANGAWIPKGPGKVIPVFQLPANHPAREYIESRNFDARLLYYQFRLSYCEEARPDVWYRSMLNGFNAGPQGRIIFYIDVNGINRGWQSRILEKVEGDFKYYFHSVSKRWIKVLQKDGDKWAPAEDRWFGWDDSKYVLGIGTRRNECLMGFDAACSWNKNERPSWCVLTEGPLDAGRIGPPGIAMMGKSLSVGQCDLIARNFSRVIYVRDNDEAGEKAVQSVETRFHECKALLVPRLKIISPPQGKDLGAMTRPLANDLIRSALTALNTTNEK